LPPGSLQSPNGVPGPWVPPWWTGPGVGTLALLLPYVEQDNLYKQVDPIYFNPIGNAGSWAYSGSSAMDPNGNLTKSGPQSMARVPIYECPSDGGILRPKTGGAFDEMYPASDCVNKDVGSMCGEYMPPPTPGYNFPALGNYIGCAGGLGNWSGGQNATYL